MQPGLMIRKIRIGGFLALSCLLTGCVTQTGTYKADIPDKEIHNQVPLGTENTQIQPQKLLIRDTSEATPVPSASEREVFNHNLENRQFWKLPRVERQYQKYLAQARLTSMLKPRWERYFGYVLAEVNARGLPSEIAVVPLVESMLDPYAFSPGAAVGMWQFVDATARENGLLINWWYDARRDPVQSTDAALDYLEKLYQRFQDWPLALAAYNGGAARISRAMRKQAKDNFWDLKLSGETANYVPRVIAFARFLAQAEQFDLEWPSPEQLAFVEVSSKRQIDLLQAASNMNISTDELYRYNPGLNRWATPPMGPHRLLVQRKHAFALKNILEDYSDDLAWQRYIIERGDSLSKIALKFHVETQELKKVNGLTSNKIRAGDALIVPGTFKRSAGSESLSNPFLFASTSSTQTKIYRVEAGDSFWSIARKFKVNMKQLIKANRLNAKRALQIGQRILI